MQEQISQVYEPGELYKVMTERSYLIIPLEDDLGRAYLKKGEIILCTDCNIEPRYRNGTLFDHLWTYYFLTPTNKIIAVYISKEKHVSYFSKLITPIKEGEDY